MRAVDVSVPKILALDEDRHWMLLEDLGVETLFSQPRPWKELEGLFLLAIEIQEKVRKIPDADVETLNPWLDSAALQRELEQTFATVLEPWGMVADSGLRRELEGFLETLCQGIGSASLVPCHRDFMARNLIPRREPTERESVEGRTDLPVLGLPVLDLLVMDHQDLRLGPSRYDLASLLNDSLFPPIELESRLLSAVLETQEEELAYRRAAVQRTLKAVGTFGAFARRGFPTHLPLIPPTLRRCLDQLEALPEGGELAQVLRRTWKKVLEGTLLDSSKGS